MQKGVAIGLLLMLDEFPAFGRLDFLESALAFMAGYGLKSFPITSHIRSRRLTVKTTRSSTNCHVRVSFATNDERTAKRVSDALATATEMRAMKNYAGHRLSPWLGHLMVSRQETARALGGFKWSSQHLDEGGCDEHSKAAFGSIWAGTIVVTRSTAGGKSRRAATLLGSDRGRDGK
jgi:TraM recognition site of TraD and TraG